MKKTLFLTTAGAVAAAFAPALAADLPGRGGAAAPAPIFTAAPFSWTGVYVGANAGLITASTKIRGFEADTAAYDYCWEGGCGGRTIAHTGALFGGQLGYNFQTGALVFGVEADLGFSTAKKSQSFSSGYDWSGKTGVEALGTARVRLGYAFDRALVYATGGLAFGKEPNSNFRNDTYGYSMPTNLGGWKTGYAVGAGVEYAIDNNWSVKAEGLYYNLGGKKAGTAAGQVSSTDYTWSAERKSTDGVVARVGLNYRFGGAASSVVARY